VAVTEDGRLISQDIAGRKYGRLTVLHRSLAVSGDTTRWYCRCDCGHFITVRGESLWSGRTKSCGCLRFKKSREEFYKGYE